jgi:hypothetical protein
MSIQSDCRMLDIEKHNRILVALKDGDAWLAEQASYLTQ